MVRSSWSLSSATVLWLLCGFAALAQPVPFISAKDEPLNVGDAKRAATEYYNSGRYQMALAGIAADAQVWIGERARQVARPAIVFDVDDTALSNWEVIQADDFGRVFGGPCEKLPEGPCGWVSWDLMARSPAIPATLSLYRFARAQGVAVFFITGRDETQRAATERNLKAAGYEDYVRLDMVPVGAHFPKAAAYKAPLRAAIGAEGYRIIANIGDQPSDLEGGHAERAFLLPNPFYRIP